MATLNDILYMAEKDLLNQFNREAMINLRIKLQAMIKSKIKDRCIAKDTDLLANYLLELLVREACIDVILSNVKSIEENRHTIYSGEELEDGLAQFLEDTSGYTNELGLLLELLITPNKVLYGKLDLSGITKPDVYETLDNMLSDQIVRLTDAVYDLQNQERTEDEIQMALEFMRRLWSDIIRISTIYQENVYLQIRVGIVEDLRSETLRKWLKEVRKYTSNLLMNPLDFDSRRGYNDIRNCIYLGLRIIKPLDVRRLNMLSDRLKGFPWKLNEVTYKREETLTDSEVLEILTKDVFGLEYKEMTDLMIM